jgi:tetratricopeptide (TPR) repeat protein
MKNISLVLCLVSFVFKANSQPPTYDDLLILFADGNYPKLIKEATKYSEKDKSKNDAIIFYWMAKGYYKLSFQADRPDEYKNAFKDCFNAIGKCLKKDKEGKLYVEYRDFFSDVKKTLVETIKNEIEAKDYRKASSWVNKAYKLTPTDIGAKLLEGVCKFHTGDKGGANAFWIDADKMLAKVTSITDYYPEDKELFKIGIFETCQCYIAMKQIDKAKTLLVKVAQLFEGDEDFKVKYNAIIN